MASRSVRSWISHVAAAAVRRHRAILALLLAIHAALLAYSAAIHSPVIDEPAHLAAGLSHWRFGDFSLYRVNPPLVRLVATAPLLLSDIKEDWRFFSPGARERREHSVGDDLVDANGGRIFRYVTIARWGCIPFSLVGAIACYAWARMLFGKVAGMAAAALWCFSPTVLGHGSLMTPDVAGTALGLAACLVFTRWLVAPSWRLALLAGALLGVAEASKSTWIILFPLLPTIWLAWRLAGSRGGGRKPAAWQLVTVLAVGWLMLLVAYGFAGVGEPLRTIPIESDSLGSLVNMADQTGRSRVRPWLADVPVPLPADYLAGMDQQLRDLETPNRNYLRGTWRTEGWWYYYVYGLGVKETCGALVMAALAFVFWTLMVGTRKPSARVSRLRRAHLAATLLVAACPLIVLAVASGKTAMNHHVRYVMPVVPYLYILAAGLFVHVGPWWTWRRLVGGALVAWAVASSLLVCPHSLSYFNEFAGGPAGGIYHLNNSNIDWGQDLLLLRDWQRRHAADRPIFLAYFGRVNPKHAGIEYQLPPIVSVDIGVREGISRLQPGWYAASVTLLQGRAYMVHEPEGRWRGCPEDAFGYFRTMKPVERVGYSIYLYHVAPVEPPLNRRAGRTTLREAAM